MKSLVLPMNRLEEIRAARDSENSVVGVQERDWSKDGDVSSLRKWD